MPANQVLLNNRSVVGVDWGAWAMRQPGQPGRAARRGAGRRGRRPLHPPPRQRPLAEAGAVLRDLLERRLLGKTVLVP